MRVILTIMPPGKKRNRSWLNNLFAKKPKQCNNNPGKCYNQIWIYLIIIHTHNVNKLLAMKKMDQQKLPPLQLQGRNIMC